MKIANWLQESTDLLTKADIPTARLDCLVLLEDQTGKSRAHLLAHPEIELTYEQISNLETQLQKRTRHIPLAYIRSRTEFYGREFIVTEHVLEPRPESETIIELLKSLPAPHTIIDVGTGSGALAVTAQLEIPNARVLAVDIDPDCLVVAAKNNAKYQTNITLAEGDLFEPYKSTNFETLAILANLPYVPNEYTINQAATNEPRLAIFGGTDGLELYRKMFKQLTNASAKSMVLLTESLPFQHASLRKIAEEYGFSQQHEQDFIQQFCRD